MFEHHRGPPTESAFSREDLRGVYLATPVKFGIATDVGLWHAHFCALSHFFFSVVKKHVMMGVCRRSQSSYVVVVVGGGVIALKTISISPPCTPIGPY